MTPQARTDRRSVLMVLAAITFICGVLGAFWWDRGFRDLNPANCRDMLAYLAEELRLLQAISSGLVFIGATLLTIALLVWRGQVPPGRGDA